MSSIRVLLTTFGFDERKIIAMMRMLAYDKLIVLTGRDSLRKKGYKCLSEIESVSPYDMETVVVDVFDFMDCLRKVNEVISMYNVQKNEVTLNISGGTKVLSDAALLAGFQNGVRTVHCEETPIELPVIRGFKVREMFTPMQKKVLLAINGPIENEKLEEKLTDEGNPLASVRKAIRELKRLDILGVNVVEKRILLFLKESQEYFRDALSP